MNGHLATRLLITTICIFSLASSGCSLKEWHKNGFKLGPNYCKPVAEVAPDWIDAADERISPECTDGSNWWLVFNDPILNELIVEAYDQNLSLREAGMRVLEARAQRGVTAGNLFPQSQSIDASYSRNLLSKNMANTPPTVDRAYNNWATSGSLLWELDFWGRFRRAVEAADADLDASVENYDDVLTCLLAEVGETYVNIRTIQQRLQYARDNIILQQGNLKIAQAQLEGGAVSAVDLRQAELSLANTRSTIPAFEEALRQQNNLLCLLLGRPTENLIPRLGEGPIPSAPASVAIGIPGDLLRRRPDVRRAERQVAAQSATIGVAETDLYPHITIAGTIGWQAQTIDTQFGSNGNFGILSPGLSWDVLNYGRFVNNIDAQKAAFQALALAYKNAVLNANKEVEDNLTTFLNSQEQAQYLAAAVEAAADGVNIVSNQYENGAINFNTVFNLQQSLVVQQNSYAVAQGDIALGLIGVYKSLGGGWQIRCDGGAIATVAAAPMDATPAGQRTLPTPPPFEPEEEENGSESPAENGETE